MTASVRSPRKGRLGSDRRPALVLSIEGLSKSYRGPDGETVLALAPLDLHVRAGQAIGLIGPSGTGKTTLLHLIAGLLEPTSGRIGWRGRNLTALPRSERDRFRARSVGYVHQRVDLLDGFSALENVMLPLALAGEGSSRADRRALAASLLWELGLGSRLDFRPEALSQGQQQRVAVARALVHRPALILADEPTASVDRATAELVMAHLQAATERWGATLLIATHDPSILFGCSRVVDLARPPAPEAPVVRT